MTLAKTLDKDRLLSQLAELKPERKGQVEDITRRVSMAIALPALTEINHENEYKLCRDVAAHLMGAIRDPDVVEY